MAFVVCFFSQQGTVELTARVREHFVMHIQGNMQLIERNPRHILVTLVALCSAGTISFFRKNKHVNAFTYSGSAFSYQATSQALHY